MISNTAEYALRATVFLAEHDDDAPVRVAEMASAMDAPQNYLSKILHVLARSGVLHSTRGPAGGFRLATPPSKLPLARIIGLFDVPPERRRCLLGRPTCSDRSPCGAHAAWREVADLATRFFAETTVADVLASAEEGGHSASGVLASAGLRRK